MAKGAKRKTKWVSLSLAGANTTTSVPVEHENDGPKTNKSASSDGSTERLHPSSEGHQNSHNGSNREHYQRGSSYPRRRLNSSSWQHGGSHYARNSTSSYTRHHYNSHYNSSNRKPHLHSTSLSNAAVSASDSRNSSNASATATANETSNPAINEDEYTRITTPRQDVLFKKGYLSRPKRPAPVTGTSSENTASSSNTGTDGSDTATGSNSLSTTASVTSETTYYPEGGPFYEYSLPSYYGYFDQNGVLIMNGFAIDSNGYSYLNGGQTYIYPPTFDCQQAPEFPEVNAAPEDVVCSGSELIGAVTTADDSEQTNDASNESELQAGDTGESVGAASVVAETPSESRGTGSEVQELPEVSVTAKDTDTIGQEVPNSEEMLPYGSAYDYAQFYNSLYYSGCILGAYPMYGNGQFVDPFVNGYDEEDYPHHAGFKKRKKRYRHCEETGVALHSGTEGPVELVAHAEDVQPELSPEVVPEEDAALVAVSSGQLNVEVQEFYPTTDTSQPTVLAAAATEKIVADKEHVTQSPKCKPKAKVTEVVRSQRSRKRDIIEATLAFAEQNIDLTKTVTLLGTGRQPTEDANLWKTVRNGREVTVTETVTEATGLTAVDAKVEEPPVVAVQAVLVEASTPLPVVVQSVVAPRKETTKKAKKITSKQKNKRQQRKINLHQQQQVGFQVFEPEFGSAEGVKCDKDETEGAQEIDEVEEEYLCDNTATRISSDEMADEIVETEVPVVPEEQEVTIYDQQLSETVSIHAAQEPSAPGEQVEAASELCNDEQRVAELVEDKLPIACDDTKEEQFDETSKSQPNIPREEVSLKEILFDTTEATNLVDNRLVDDEVECTGPTSGEEFAENCDSGLQSPATFNGMTDSSSDTKERKCSASSFGNEPVQVTDAVTRWLTETLECQKLEELFVLPHDPALLQRIQRYHMLHYDDSLTDSFSEEEEDEDDDDGDDEADEGLDEDDKDAERDTDSDYMSDVQVKKQKNDITDDPTSTTDTTPAKCPLTKCDQTENGRRLLSPGSATLKHDKTARCVIM